MDLIFNLCFADFFYNRLNKFLKVGKGVGVIPLECAALFSLCNKAMEAATATAALCQLRNCSILINWKNSSLDKSREDIPETNQMVGF